MTRRTMLCAALCAAAAGLCAQAVAASGPWKKAEIEHETCTIPSWSPDGKVLAFAVRDREAVQVWTVDPKGKRSKAFESSRIKPETGGARFMAVEILWLRNPDAPMLILGEMIAGDRRTGGDRCELLRFFVLEPGKPEKANQVAASSPMGPGPAFGPKHFAALPEGKGAAACFTIWPSNLTPDDTHCGTFLSVCRDGSLNFTGKKFRWIENAPDGRLIGVRHDSISEIDAAGNVKEELHKFDASAPMIGTLHALRLSADGSRMAWSLFVNSGPPDAPHEEWHWKEKGKDPIPLSFPALDGAHVKDVRFLPDGRLVAALEKQGKALDPKILDPAAGTAEEWRMPGIPASGVHMLGLSPWGLAGVAAVRGPGMRIGKDGMIAGLENSGFAFSIKEGKVDKASAVGLMFTQPIRMPGGSLGRAEADLRYLSFPVEWAAGRAAFAALCPRLVDTGTFIDESRAEDPRRIEGKLVLWSAEK